MTEQASYSENVFQVAIVGGGVVGCAVFREFVLAGANTILLERDQDLINGASKGNSGLLHTGFDAPLGTLEAKCIRDGYRIYGEIHERLHLPLRKTGAIVVAWTDEEAAKLPRILHQAHANGVDDVRPMGADELRQRESELSASVRTGLYVPGESIVDPWSAPLAYALQGIANGGVVKRDAEVISGTFAEDKWLLTTTAGDIRASVVINCAGNYGDIVEAIARPSPFQIRPRKGQFVVFDKSAFELAQSILLPVPNELTKGVVVSQTAFGNLIVGPTAEDQDDRRIATVEEATLNALVQEGQRILPKLREHRVTAVYAGLRPATQFKDYQIEALPGQRWITVSGIRSTGLTSCLGIGRYVNQLYQEHFGRLTKLNDVSWTPVPNLSEDRLRPYQQAGRSDIVCHCEFVTQDEIEAALRGPLPVATVGGLRRRTRCMMGRCQGFYCTRRVAQITAGGLAELPNVGSAARKVG